MNPFESLSEISKFEILEDTLLKHSPSFQLNDIQLKTSDRNIESSLIGAALNVINNKENENVRCKN